MRPELVTTVTVFTSVLAFAISVASLSSAAGTVVTPPVASHEESFRHPPAPVEAAECLSREDGSPGLCQSTAKTLIPRWSDGHVATLDLPEGWGRLEGAGSQPCLLWDKGTPREVVTCR